MNKTIMFSYYDDIWMDLYLLPSDKLDYFTVTKPRLEENIPIGKVYHLNSEDDGLLNKIKIALLFYCNLPLLLRYKNFIFVTPPYFHFIAIPFLKLVGKKVFTIIGDAYSEIVFEQLWLTSRFRRSVRYVLYPVYLISEYVSVIFSDKVFTVSRYLLEKYKRFNKETYYTPNGAPVKMVSVVKPKKAVKDPYIIYVGALLKWRGIDLMLKAFENVKKQYKHPLKIVVVGGKKDENLDQYKELARFKNNKDIIFTGRLPHTEALSLMKCAIMGIMPNRNTLLSRTISSIKVLEYMCSEIPQICTDSGEHAYWVNKLGIGIVVKDDVESIEKGILKMLNDRKLYNECKTNCKKRNSMDSSNTRRLIIDTVRNLK